MAFISCLQGAQSVREGSGRLVSPQLLGFTRSLCHGWQGNGGPG